MCVCVCVCESGCVNKHCIKANGAAHHLPLYLSVPHSALQIVSKDFFLATKQPAHTHTQHTHAYTYTGE